MDFLKGIGGKIVAGVVALVVIGSAISWWRMDAAGRDAILSVAGRTGAWILIVLLAPWALFWVVTWVARFQRNSAGAALVAALTLLEMVVLGLLFDWNLGGSTLGWAYVAVGALLAAVYNLFTCDWIAERME